MWKINVMRGDASVIPRQGVVLYMLSGTVFWVAWKKINAE
jgi:hypothetical protein